LLNMLLKFSLVGLSGFAINMAVYLTVLHLGTTYIIAAIPAFLIAVTNNFAWNLRWTFQGRAKDKSNELKYISFVAISTANLGVNLLILHLLVESGGIDKTLAQLFSIAVVSLLNFTLNYCVTFREPGSEEAPTEYETGYHSNL